MKKALNMCMIIALVFQAGCFIKYFNKVSKYYQPDEKAILESTTAALECGWGYDIDLELDYIYFAGPDTALTPEKKKALEDAIKDIPADVMKSFHEKIYMLKSITIARMEEYREDEDWNEATLIEKYYLPPLEFYQARIQEVTFAKDPSLAPAWDARRADIDAAVAEEYR